MTRNSKYALTVVAVLAAFGAVLAATPRTPVATLMAPPIPLSPEPGTKGNQPNPELVVQASGAEEYQFRVYRQSTGQLVAEANTIDNRWRVEPFLPGLQPGKYVWTCRALYGDWTKYFAPEWTFEVEAPVDDARDDAPRGRLAPPVAESPVPGRKSKGSETVTLEVGDVPGAVTYHWRVFRDAAGRTYCEGFTELPSWIVPVMLPAPTGIYYWNCRVSDGNVWSDFFWPAWWYEIEKPASGAATDGATAGATDSRTPVRMSALPNPFGPGGTAISFSTGHAGPYQLTFHSVDGGLVRSINGRAGSGPTRVIWNGKDNNGRDVAAGTYLCRVRATGAIGSVRVIKSR